MYTSEQIYNALTIMADPDIKGSTARWAEDVFTWAELHLTEYEKEHIVRAFA